MKRRPTKYDVLDYLWAAFIVVWSVIMFVAMIVVLAFNEIVARTRNHPLWQRSSPIMGALLAMLLLIFVSMGRSETLSGTLQKPDTYYTMDGIEVDFGADWYIARTTATMDYDHDGAIETIASEIAGLEGKSFTLGGEYGRHGDFDVFTIQGVAYRDPKGGPPPWAGGPQR